jgi:hypothetical protein
MSSTLAIMGKTEQVRVPTEVMDEVRMTCAAFKEAAHEYVTRAVQEALRRDMPEAAKIISRQAAKKSQDRKGADHA